jgi:hypothetical protein
VVISIDRSIAVPQVGWYYQAPIHSSELAKMIRRKRWYSTNRKTQIQLAIAIVAGILVGLIFVLWLSMLHTRN